MREKKGKFKFTKANSTELKRIFTVQALESCELLALKIQDLEKIKFEFPDIFTEFFMNAFNRLKKAVKQKNKVIKIV